MVFSADKLLFSFLEALKSTHLWDTERLYFWGEGCTLQVKGALLCPCFQAGEALGVSELSWHCPGLEKQTSRPIWHNHPSPTAVPTILSVFSLLLCLLICNDDSSWKLKKAYFPWLTNPRELNLPDVENSQKPRLPWMGVKFFRVCLHWFYRNAWEAIFKSNFWQEVQMSVSYFLSYWIPLLVKRCSEGVWCQVRIPSER